MSDSQNIDLIRDIVIKHARIPAASAALTAEADLYALGLSSMTTVHLMVALEDQFEVEFPDRMLGRKTFQSLQAMADAVEELKGG